MGWLSDKVNELSDRRMDRYRDALVAEGDAIVEWLIDRAQAMDPGDEAAEQHAARDFDTMVRAERIPVDRIQWASGSLVANPQGWERHRASRILHLANERWKSGDRPSHWA
jgi:hypothetical protein